MNATLSATARAGLSATDLSQGQLYIEQTRDGLLGSVRTLTPTQWNYKSTPDRWSIAENVEHVVAIHELVIGMIQQGLASAPPPPPEQDAAIVDSIVINQIPNRLVKFPSPVPVTCRFDKPGAIQRYLETCGTLTEMLSSTPELREHVLEAAPLKAISKGAYSVMDGYQWILASAAHAERHTKQILEVIATSTFPIGPARDYQCTIEARVSASEAFDKIALVRQWWALTFEGSARRRGDTFSVRFGETFVEFRIADAVPDTRIVWEVVNSNLHSLRNKTEWTGTRVEWELSSGDDVTTVRMTHRGLVPAVECYNDCEKGWNFYVGKSLVRFLTEGEGLPHGHTGVCAANRETARTEIGVRDRVNTR